jgi:hypothetical protein
LGGRHDVFISYSDEDRAAANTVCAILERKGLQCWIAHRDLTPGEDWSAAIVAAIENAKVLVILFSSFAIASPYVKRELECAVSSNLAILPLRIDQAKPGSSFRLYLSTAHWMDAFTPPIEQYADRLAAAVHALIGEDGAKAGSSDRAEWRSPSSSGPGPPPAGGSSLQRAGLNGLQVVALLGVLLAGSALVVGASPWFRKPPVSRPPAPTVERPPITSKEDPAVEAPAPISNPEPQQASVNSAPNSLAFGKALSLGPIGSGVWAAEREDLAKNGHWAILICDRPKTRPPPSTNGLLNVREGDDYLSKPTPLSRARSSITAGQLQAVFGAGHVVTLEEVAPYRDRARVTGPIADMAAGLSLCGKVKELSYGYELNCNPMIVSEAHPNGLLPSLSGC